MRELCKYGKECGNKICHSECPSYEEKEKLSPITMAFAVKVLDEFAGEEGSVEEQRSWDKVKEFIKAVQEVRG